MKLRVLAAFNGVELFGHERGNLEVLKSLQAAGAVIRIGLSEQAKGGLLQEEVVRLGFEHFSIPFGCQWSKTFFKKHPTLLFKNLYQAWCSNRRFSQEIKSFKPTHLHLGNSLAFSYLSNAIKKSPAPLVIRLGDCPPTGSPVQLYLWRKFVEASTSVVANSAFVWNTSAAASPHMAALPASVIHNKAPMSSLPVVAQVFDPTKRHVVYVGQLSREKGIFEIVDAAALLRISHPDIQFHIVGGSRYTTGVKEEMLARIQTLQLQETILLHDWVSNPLPFYQNASVHLAPSVWDEPFCNVILEAKREGTPSVAFPSGGIPEMINHLSNGFLCNEKTAKELATGVAWVMDKSESDYLALRNDVAADYRDRFGEDRFGTQWLAHYAGER